MVRRSQSNGPDEDLVNSLTVSPDTVCHIIVKAREFDVKDVNTGDSSEDSDENYMGAVLEDRADDPVFQELVEFISGRTVDERIDLVALAWLGREEDYGIEDWPALRAEAAREQGPDGRRTAHYLLGIPLLGDYLEEGLSMFGESCQSFETDRL